MSEQENPIILHCIYCNHEHPELDGDALYEHIEQNLDDLNRRFRERRALNEEHHTIIDCPMWPGCRHRPLTSLEGDGHAISWTYVEIAYDTMGDHKEFISCELCGTRHVILTGQFLEIHIRDCHSLVFEIPMVAHPSPSELTELPPSTMSGSDPMEPEAAEESQVDVSEADVVEAEDARAQGSAEEAAAEAEYDSEEEEPEDLPHDLGPFRTSLEQALSNNILTVENFAQVICTICRDHRVPVKHLPRLNFYNALRARLAPLLDQLMYNPRVHNNNRVTAQYATRRIQGTTIGEAILENKVRPIQVLCDLGFRINVIMHSNLTVLGAAILRQQSKIAQYLLNPEFKEKYGVDPFRPVTLDTRFADSTTPIALCVNRYEYGVLKTILSYETPPNVMRTEDVNQLFRSQLWNRLSHIVHDQYFRDAIFAARNAPISPIHCAVVNPDLFVLRNLVWVRADHPNILPDLADHINAENNTIIQNATPLLLALHRQNAEALTILLKTPGIDPSRPNSRMLTPLYYAARIANLELARILIEYRADPRVVTAMGTPLHALVHTYREAKERRMAENPQEWAFLKEKLAQLQLLFLESGVDPDARPDGADAMGRTAGEEAELVEYWEFSNVLVAFRNAAAAPAPAAVA
ncbi:hypothetical protein AnigIFM60653_002788 [Aspergillus niger]|nr:hypothetical protein AnigIFM60653_002788 [Aspergillus niger]